MRERRPMTNEDPVSDYEDYDHFLASGRIPKGRFVIPYEEIPVDFLYAPVEGAQTTVVFFHGSTSKTVKLPMHAGAGMMRNLPANRLAISDPSIALDDSHDLILSWYTGSAKQPRLQYFIETVIRRIQEVTGIEHLIFTGGSGGGFASLEMSRRFAGSIALAMNPQTNFARYYAGLVKNYLTLCWDGASSLAELPAHVSVDLREAYSEVLTHTIAYVQNTRDKHHVENHQVPFFEKVGSSPNTFMLMDAWGDPTGKGHVPPPRELIRDILQQLVLANGDWCGTLMNLGFDPRTDAQTVEQVVQQANANLPIDHEIDVM